jgi:hypothetical protein
MSCLTAYVGHRRVRFSNEIGTTCLPVDRQFRVHTGDRFLGTAVDARRECAVLFRLRCRGVRRHTLQRGGSLSLSAAGTSPAAGNRQFRPSLKSAKRQVSYTPRVWHRNYGGGNHLPQFRIRLARGSWTNRCSLADRPKRSGLPSENTPPRV